MSTEKITDRFHRESLDGVDAVLERMVKALGLDIGFGFAEALDVSRDTVKTWRRRGEVPMRFLTGFAKAHGLSLDYLRFGGSGQNEPDENRAIGISEAAVHQAVLEAVDLLSLEKKVDAQQLAKAVVKLCVRHVLAQKQTSINVGSNHGQVVEGGQVNHGPISFGTGKAPDKKT